MGWVRTGLVKWKFCEWEGEGKEKREVKRAEDVHVISEKREKNICLGR